MAQKSSRAREARFGTKVLPLADAATIAQGVSVAAIDALAERTGLTKSLIKQVAGISEGTLAVPLIPTLL